jgi:hypothetical protein
MNKLCGCLANVTIGACQSLLASYAIFASRFRLLSFIFLVYVNHLWFVISEIDPLTTSDQFKQLIHLIRRISA